MWDKFKNASDFFIVLIVVGALATTGIFGFAGRATKSLPMAIGDFWYGLTGKELKYQSTGMINLGPLSLDLGRAKTFEVPTSEYAGDSVSPSSGQESQITWGEEATGSEDWSVDDSSTGEAVEQPQINVEARRECALAKGKLQGLQGSSDPEAVMSAAERVINRCQEVDPEALGEASAALSAAEKELATQEARAQARAERVEHWQQLQAQAQNLAVNDPQAVKSLIDKAGGIFHLQKIDGLWPGMLKNITGGGETVYLVVYPPAEIADAEGVEPINIKTQWMTLEAWGFKKVPQVPGDYTTNAEAVGR